MMDKPKPTRKKSVQFCVEVFDERDTQCGIPLCPAGKFSGLKLLLPLGYFLVFVQGVVSGNSDPKDIGQEISVALTAVLFGFLGRSHKPRWLGVAATLTAVACFLQGFKSSTHSELWILDFLSQFLNGIAIGLSITLGSSYLDNNFPCYFPAILGAGASITTVGKLVEAETAHWMTFGGIVGISTIPIALLPKVIHRIPTKKYGTTVNPTDDPSLLQELRSSFWVVVKNEKVIYNCAATALFFLGFNIVCNERVSVGAQALGFLAMSWIIQLAKPRGRILIGSNIVLGLGFLGGSLYQSFTCNCDAISLAIFTGFSFLSCFGRIGSFLFCARSVERDDKPVAIGLTLAVLSLLLIPKVILTDYSCSLCHDHAEYEMIYASACSKSCCERNLIPHLVGAGFTFMAILFDCLVWKCAELELYP